MNITSYRTTRVPLATYALLVCFSLAGAKVFAADLDKRVDLDIPADIPLDAALIQWSVQTGIQLMLATHSFAGQAAVGVQGKMDAGSALTKLLRDSGLVYKVSDGTVSIVPAEPLQASTNSVRVSDAQVSGESPTYSDGASVSANTRQPGGDSESDPTVEVIVTAQKRAQRLQDVPMSISAFNQEEVTRLGITGLDTLSRQVPDLSLSNSYGGEPIISIRGISTGYGLAPAVSVYIDDTPLDTRTDLFSGTGLIDLFDLERVEVLRGPQGTLFGASSMGGAIRVITAPPDPKGFSTSWEAGVADTEGGGVSYLAKGAMNIPLADTLAMRLVATHSEDAGWIDRSLPTDFANITPNEPITKRNENTVTKSSFRLALRWMPDETWTLAPSFIYQNTATVGQPSYYPDAGRFVRPHLFADGGSYNTKISSLKIEKDLGWSTITSATAYMTKSTNYSWDYSEYGQYFGESFGLGSTIVPLALHIPVSYHQFTEELRFTSANLGRWRWIIGAYLNNTTQANYEYAYSDAFLPAGSSTVDTYDAPVHDHQIAAFGELTFAPTANLEITGGLREYRLQTTERITQGGLLAGANVPRTTETASGLNPKVTATFKFSKTVNLYATAAKGFRAGGPNAGIFSGPCNFLSLYKTTYDPDTVWNYEVGSKASLMNGHLSIDASAFQMNWDKFQGQVSSTCGVFTANIGTVRMRGVELESNWHLNRYLSGHASFGYDDAKIRDLGPGFQDAGVGSVGQQVVNVPRLQFALGAELDLPMSGDWTGFARPDWQHVGSAQTSYAPFTGSIRPAYNNVDLTLGMRARRWVLSLYTRNLTNSLQIVGITPPVLDGPVYLAGRPRTYGLTVSYSY